MKITLQCDNCGVQFEREKTNKKSQYVYCGKKCQDEAYKERFSDELTPYRRMHNKAANRAKRVGKEFSLSVEDIRSLWENQNGLCKLSGEELSIEDTRKNKDHGSTNASLDRIRSYGGYTIDNVQIVHKDINQMKFDMDQAKFISYCHKVALKNPLDTDDAQRDNVVVDSETPF